MPKINAKQHGHNLDIAMLGMKLEFNPLYLLKESFSKGTAELLDEIIEAEYKKAIKNFNEWHLTVFKGVKGKEREQLEEKYHTQECAQEILNLACFHYDILPLHSDSEMIELSEKEKAIEEVAYQFWKYNKLYGFVPSEEKQPVVEEKKSTVEQVKVITEKKEQPVQNQQQQNQNQQKPNIHSNQNQQKKQGANNQNAYGFPESVELNPPVVEMGADGLPKWFVDGLKLMATNMQPREAAHYLYNITRNQNTEQGFGQKEITDWINANHPLVKKK